LFFDAPRWLWTAITIDSKIHAFMKQTYLSLLMLALLGCCAPVWAERADHDQPMNIEADNLRHVDANQVSIFSGRVVLTKGSIVMRGAMLEARQDPQGNQYGVLTAEPGKRAYFRQKRDGVDEYIEGEAERIEYDGRAEKVRFVRRAELRRYRGATLGDEITGNQITYDNKTDAFSVDGASNAPAGGSGRVKAMLTPRPTAEAAQPAASAPAPLKLRVTPSLSGDRK
jgi:lipopolysaccharide export system protein LptA